MSGPGVWSGDVFGSGEPTTVNFTVGTTGDGAPDITGVTVASPHEHTIGATDYQSDEDGDASASVKIEFTAAGQTRTLRIKAKVDTGHDRKNADNADEATGETRAKLSIALSKIRGRQIAAGDAVGPHSWTGMLCDGTTATVDYTVTEDGSVSDVAAIPEGAEVKTAQHGATVRFATGERVNIRVKSEGDEMTVGVRTKIRCEASDPSVNTPIDPQADRDERDHDRGDKKSDQGNERGDKKRPGRRSRRQEVRAGRRQPIRQRPREEGRLGTGSRRQSWRLTLRGSPAVHVVRSS